MECDERWKKFLLFVLSVSLLVGGIVLVDIKKTMTRSDVSKREKKSKFKEANVPIMLKDNFQSRLENFKYFPSSILKHLPLDFLLAIFKYSLAVEKLPNS